MSYANFTILLSYLFLLLLLITRLNVVTCAGVGNGGPSSSNDAEPTSPPLSLADQSDELSVEAEPLRSVGLMSEKDEFLDDANSLRLVPIDVVGAPQKPTLRYLSAPLSDGKTSILIPLPSDLDEKTGLVFVEDIRDGDLSQRTFRTHIFRPSRSSPITFEVAPTRTTTGRVRGARHSSASNVNTLNNVNKLLGRVEFDSTKAPRTTSTTTTTTSTTEATTSNSEEEETTVMTVTTSTKPSSALSKRTKPPRRTVNKRINSALDSLRTAITVATGGVGGASTAPSVVTAATEFADSAEIETTTSSNDFTDATLTTVESLRRRPPTTTVPRNSPSSVTGNTITTTARTRSTTVRSTTRTTQRIRDRPRPRSLPPTAAPPASAAVITDRSNGSRVRDTETELIPATQTPVANTTTSNSTLSPNSDESTSAEQSSQSSSQSFRGRNAKASTDYPTYAEIPTTRFDCKDVQYPGFYADMETGCQVYHSCSRGRRHSFLCPNGTIFSQEFFICDWAYNVECTDSPMYFELNKDAFSAPVKNKNKNEKKENSIAASA